MPHGRARLRHVHGTVYNSYLALISFTDETAHLAVLMPLWGGDICILDPAGNYATERYGSLTSKAPSTELQSYAAHWSTEHVIETIKLRAVPDPTAASGAAIVYVNTTHRTRTIWYGPYVIAPEGNYTAAFTLRAGALNDTGAVTIDARSGGATLANAAIGPASFAGAGEWRAFTLTTVSTDLELRGLLQGDDTSIALDRIRLTQTGQGKRLNGRRR